MLGPEMAAVADKKKESAAAATKFGEGIVEPRGARASSSSSSSLFSSSQTNGHSRRHALVARAKKDTKKHEEARSPERTAVAALSRRQPRKSPAAAMKRDEEVRSRETTAVAVISRRQPRQRDIEVRSPKRTAVAASSRRQPRGEEVSSPKRTAVAASRKRQPRRSSPSPPPPSFVPRRNIKPRRDLQQKERVRQCDFGYSSSEDQRACRSGGTRVRVHASIPQSRHAAASIPQSVQPASRSRGMHTREQVRGSLALENKRPRRRYQESISIDSRDVSPVEARRPRPGGLASRCQSRLHYSLRQSARQLNSFQQGPRGSRGRGGRYGIAFRLRSCGGSCGISRSLQNRPSGDHRPHSVQSRSRRHCRSRGRSGHSGSVTSSSALPTFPTLRQSLASRSGSLSRRFTAMLFCVRRTIPQLRSGSRIAVGLSLHLSTSCWNPSALSISQLVFSWSCCGDTSRI